MYHLGRGRGSGALLTKSGTTQKQVRFVSVKAERPNHLSHCHARGGGFSRWGVVGVSQWRGGVLHDNANTDVTP